MYKYHIDKYKLHKTIVPCEKSFKKWLRLKPVISAPWISRSVTDSGNPFKICEGSPALACQMTQSLVAPGREYTSQILCCESGSAA